MLTRRLPDPTTMDRFVGSESTTPFTYPVGLTRRQPTPGWFVEDVSAVLGTGEATLAAAVDALDAWEQCDLGWFVVHRPASGLLQTGSVVGYSARALGLWWSYCCRVVETIDERDEHGSRRVGFAYGTIGTHAERGEERFLVTHDAASDEVRASILAVSRPGRWFTVLGLPLARRAQVRFKPDALAAWERGVRRRLSP